MKSAILLSSLTRLSPAHYPVCADGQVVGDCATVWVRMVEFDGNVLDALDYAGSVMQDGETVLNTVPLNG